MAAIVIRENAKAAWFTGIAGVRAKAREMVRRALDCAAAAVLICAVSAALLQLAAELVSFPAPLAVTAITVVAAALLNSLRRHIRQGAAAMALAGLRGFARALTSWLTPQLSRGRAADGS